MCQKMLLLFFLCTLLVCPAIGKDHYLQPGPIHLDHGGEKWAEKTLKHMSLEEKIGQMFVIWVRAEFLNLANPEYTQLRDTIQKYHVGALGLTVHVDGASLLKSEPFEAAMLINQLQRDSKLPLIFAADFERGVAMRLNGTTGFPHAMAFGAAGKPEFAEAFGRITALEARAIGVEWNFFPDADVNSNPANPIINTRSFGEDPQQVGDLVAAYIQGAHANGMLTTAKHFPGHGDTDTDSHLALARVGGDVNRLNAVELPPFRKAIAAGVDAVMVAHVTVPALEPDANRVGTTSLAIATGLLKRELGFQGLVVTDAMDMAGLTRLYASNVGRGAVDAVKAGNDLILIPPDLDASYTALLNAVRSGEIPEAQIDGSVLKLLRAKASVGLNKARLVDTTQLSTIVGKPENLAQGQQIAEAAVTLVRDNGRALPLHSQGTATAKLPYQPGAEVGNRVVAVIMSDDMRTEAGRRFEKEFLARVPDARVIYVDPRTAAAMTDTVTDAVNRAETVVAAVYVVPTAGKAVQVRGTMTNSVALADSSGELLQQILDRAATKTVVIAMGNPYLAASFPAIENYLCTFSNAPVSEIGAVKALFGEIAIRGRLPVTIPNVAQRGEGLERGQRASEVTGR
jgi:beta-N-acetylhexosaminidase